MVVLFVSLSALGIDYIYLTEIKLLLSKKIYLKNWKNGKNDRLSYLCTQKWLFTTMTNSCFQEKVFIFNVRALNMHKIQRSKEAQFNLFGLL